ncbi:capsule assembly Wzi family protein [Thioalkalivibrio sp. XN279]|uniref:capsule assembly Wzi family protein n=1 Tax=Thioalkalivibrio sp. XN279 TaxID=2714953 RepID=UPI001409A270|nr:capsule assembly Wzi family protein [Thioalkalivibrio sp. XN279]NHA15461.1 capsule assembly Wzi family protein [Thioalkalivibrio sp. XN279]
MHMPKTKRLLIGTAAILLALPASPALADPWARPGDLALRHDVQLLADAGVIKSPVTTWPIPWGTLTADLAAIDDCGTSDIGWNGGAERDRAACARLGDPDVAAALARLQSRLATVRGLRGLQPNARVAVRTDEGIWLRTFEDTPRDDLEARVGVSWMGDRFAARAQVAYADEPRPGDREWRGDGSYIAGIFANQVIHAGALDRWWGPGHSDSLILSSNARPVSALGIERHVAKPFETKWLSWLGAWNYSLVWGFLESGRDVPNARLTAFRFNFRPTDNLEIGLSRAAQWCGQGRPCGFSTFTDLVLGRDNRGDDDLTIDTEPGNQLAAVDFRWRSPFMRQPWAIYGQATAEDEAGGTPSLWFGQLGIEAWGQIDAGWLSGRWRAHFEYSNTLASFYKSNPRYDTAYEHSIYTSGYRYYGRTIGASLDGDSEVLSAGVTLVDRNERTWHALIRAGTLNELGGGAGRDAIHSVAPAETKIFSAQLSHSRELQYNGLKLGTVSAGFGLQSADNEVTGESETDAQVFLQWTWDYSGL